MRAAGRTVRDVLPFVLAGAVVLTILLLAPPSPRPEPVGSGPAEAVRPTAPELVVDPSRWWMPAGNSTTLSAAWIDVPPGCDVSAAWYRWTVAGGAAVGLLNSTAGENVTFVAATAVSGTTTLAVRSVDLEQCGPASATGVGAAEANLTVDAPLELEDLEDVPAVIPAGGTSALDGAIYGGEPPYSLRIVWGDETTTETAVAGPGAFDVPHAYPAGMYRPSVVVTDSAGLVAAGSADEILTASDGLALGIASNGSEVDVGEPTTFAPDALDVPIGSLSGWSCGTPAITNPILTLTLANVSCTFTQAGVGSVVLEVYPVAPELPVSTTLTVSVEPTPALLAATAAQAGEVGQPAAVAFAVQGGVPPFRLDWSEVGTDVAGSLSVPADGVVELPLVPGAPGSLAIVAHLVDADDVASATATTSLFVDPALNVTLATARAVDPTNVSIGLEANVVGGAAPFLWGVIPTTAPDSATAGTGLLDSAGSFDWEGWYAEDGNASGTAVVVDADGAFRAVPFDVATVPPLRAQVTLLSDGGAAPGQFTAVLDVSGGLPPFEIGVRASDGSNWNLTAAADGGESWSLTVSTGGPLSVSVSVADALGPEWNETGSVLVAPAPPATAVGVPSGTSAVDPLAPVGVVAAVLLGAGGTYFLRRRRRAQAAPVPTVDPVAVLRGIIEPADGVDRSTAELLADEAGVPLEEAHAAIDRLIADGTVRSAKDPDGGEVLAWSVLS